MPRKVDIGHEISGWSDSYLRQFLTWLFGRYKFDRAELVEFRKTYRDTGRADEAMTPAQERLIQREGQYAYKPADEHDDNLLDIFNQIDTLCNDARWTMGRRQTVETIVELVARGRQLLKGKS